MNKRWPINVILLSIAFFSYSVCFSVYGSSCASAFFDSSAAMLQINKNFMLVVVIFFLILAASAIIMFMLYTRRRKKAEASLIRDEEILSTLINETPDIIFYKDADGRYLEINQSTIDIFRFDKDNCKGKKKCELDELSPFYRSVSEKCRLLDEKAWESGAIHRSIEVLNMPDGAKRTYDVIKAPIFYKDGRRKGIVTQARDITTHKEAEEKLERKEKILRATLNATDDGILVVDNNRQVLEANDLYFNMWNIPWDVYSLNNETANLKFIKKQLLESDTFEAWVNFTYEVPVTEHYTAHLIDGRIYDVFSTPLMEKGHMIGRVWSFRDITARLNAEKELHKSEERYRTLVELSPDAIFVNVNGRNVFSNMAAVRLLGAESREDINQRFMLDFVHPDTRAFTEKKFNDIISGKEELSMSEQKIVRFDGKYVDTESVCSLIPYRGENAIMCVVRDISERRRNEELKHKMVENMKLVRETLEYDKIKTEFFANISHEIKTPLNIIIGTLQLLEFIINGQQAEGSLDKLTKYTSIMRQNCFRLLRMMNNLIYITEIDSGFVEMYVKNHDLVQIIKDIISSVSVFVEGKGVKLNMNTELDGLETACDSDKIERVILNLLSNAVKFTEAGDEISVSLYKRDDYVYISVKDTGIGIPDEMKEIIFQRFRQVDKSFTRRCEGSGIGLSLAKSLVEMHDGTIEVKSEYGKGSEFIIKFPVCLMEDDEIAAAADDKASVCIDMVNIEFSDIY